jgi:acyl carrier protein
MIPSFFVFMDALPISPAGKIDRRSLPAPEGTRPEWMREFVAPRTPVEQQLGDMACELLNLDKIGVYDSFFDLGGHSLLATQFVSRVREEFDVEIPLRSLFEHPTIAELAEEIEIARRRGDVPSAPTIERVSRDSRRMKRATLSRSGTGDTEESLS